MLGLTTPDAIAFGSLCAALAAAYAGLIKGDRVRTSIETRRPDRADAMLEAVGDLAVAVSDLAQAIRSATAAEAAHDQYSALIHDLVEQIHNNIRSEI